MNILATLIKPADFIFAPLCFLLLLMVFSISIRKYKDEKFRKLFLNAFYFKMVCTIFFTIITHYYYGGADSEMYYYCIQHLHKAVLDDPSNFIDIYMTKAINVETPLMNYFIYTDSPYPDFQAMHDPGNFWVPKFGLPFSILFNNSYVSISMFFSFFALAGAIRLFKFFYHYFPQYYREIAVATLFLPSVGYWSSGLLKDPICFGAVGFIVYGFLNIFIKRRNYASSILWIAFSAFLVYYIKVYILLALMPALVLWLFGEFNKVVKSKTLRRVMATFTLSLGVYLAIILLNYATSEESLKSYRFDTISQTSAYSRSLYETPGGNKDGAYYQIGTSNPILLLLNGIAATFFRPFLWEVNGITALFSALESLFFLILTLVLIYKRGVLNFFRKAFSHPVLMMCFVFSIVFAAAVGSSALNFGSLSRYKIPCLPFYLLMILILYRQGGLAYPRWLNKLFGYKTTDFRRVKKIAI